MNHIVVYLPVLEYSSEEYYKKYCELFQYFREQIIFKPLENIVEEIKQRYEKKHKEIYPYFATLMVFGLPIDDYVQQYSCSPFKETYLLSSEEAMAVAVCRKRQEKNR